MDFTFENPGWVFSQKENSSWADNVYQKVPCKYVNVMGEHVKKFLDEVDEWLDPSSNHAKETDFDKSSDTDSTTELWKKSSERVDENNLNELATSAIEEPIISSMEDMKLVTPPDVAQDTLSNEREKEQIPAEATDSSCTGVDGNYRKLADAFTSSDFTSALSTDEALPSESRKKNMVLEERFMLSGNNASTEICNVIVGTSTSRGIASLVHSLGNEHQQKFGTNRSEADVQLPESAVSEISDLSARESLFNSTDLDDLSTELGELEDVDLQDSWDDDDEDYELALVSCQEFKNRSYKKKLRAAIISKLRPLKDYGQAAYWHQDNSKRMQDRQGITAASIHDTMEADWEFL
uniref:Uncharacterized protein LOC105040677 isoform X2 n=1 Tax=Elaeis guineensis var. tenera TaxID=51953 RepID=A0A6I9QWN4_ELAGV|nr:uncharacterized protein LOC105040677 isoform X2 [Elaeis guineensis]XP_010915627.1 uncharacterized protein LOC105040677 isoform X2 [Elaeis guineensis]